MQIFAQDGDDGLRQEMEEVSAANSTSTKKTKPMILPANIPLNTCAEQ